MSLHIRTTRQPTEDERKKWVENANTESWQGPRQTKPRSFYPDKNLFAIPEEPEEQEKTQETVENTPKLDELKNKV